MTTDAVGHLVRSGRPLSGVYVLDCHGHLGTAPDFTIRGGTAEDVVARMDRLGVDELCVSALSAIWGDPCQGNGETADAVHRFPTRLRGYVVANPHYRREMLDMIESYRTYPRMRMMKIHPTVHQCAVDGPAYRPLWEFANDNEAIVLSHTFAGDPFCRPALFGDLARAYPRTKILLGHMGATHAGLEEAIEVAASAENTYLDIASSFSPFGSIERAVQAVGAERVLFGSDVPFFDLAVSVGRIAYARISDAAKELILGSNMSRLVGAA